MCGDACLDHFQVAFLWGMGCMSVPLWPSPQRKDGNSLIPWDFAAIRSWQIHWINMPIQTTSVLPRSQRCGVAIKVEAQEKSIWSEICKILSKNRSFRWWPHVSRCRGALCGYPWVYESAQSFQGRAVVLVLLVVVGVSYCSDVAKKRETFQGKPVLQ